MPDASKKNNNSGFHRLRLLVPQPLRMVFSCLTPPPPEMYLFIFNEKHDAGAILGLGHGRQGKMLGLAGGLCLCHRLQGAAPPSRAAARRAGPRRLPGRLSPDFLCPNSLGNQARADPCAAVYCFLETLGFYRARRGFFGGKPHTGCWGISRCDAPQPPRLRGIPSLRVADGDLMWNICSGSIKCWL